MNAKQEPKLVAPTAPNTRQRVSGLVAQSAIQNNAVLDTGDAIAWTSPAGQEKSFAWHVLAIIGVVALSVVLYFLNRDVVTSILVMIALVGLVIFIGRSHKSQQYRLDELGFQAGGKYYNFAEMRSFSVYESSQSTIISLVPLKRFTPMIAMEVPSSAADSVIDRISAALPYEERDPDWAESLSRKMRF